MPGACPSSATSTVGTAGGTRCADGRKAVGLVGVWTGYSADQVAGQVRDELTKQKLLIPEVVEAVSKRVRDRLLDEVKKAP